MKVKPGSDERPGDQPAMQTLAGSVVGTPAFMAPEQARGESVGPAADVYALGGVLYYLLTDRTPYQGDSAVEVLDHLLLEPPPPPSDIRPDTPPELEILCLHAMRRDATGRFPDAGALVQALEVALADWRAHAGSRALADKALPWLDTLRQAAEEDSPGGDRVGEAWDALRSGLEQALALWPANTQAQEALDEARSLLEQWTRAEKRGLPRDEPDPMAEGVLLDAITRGERLAALIRFVVGCMGLTIELATAMDRVLARSPEALAITGASAGLVITSPLVVAWLRKHSITRRLLLISVTMDVLTAISVPLGFVLAWTDEHNALPWVPGSYFVVLAVVLAGARLSPGVATWAGALAVSLFGALTWMDVGRSVPRDVTLDYLAIYTLLIASWVFAVAIAARGRSLVYRALANARAAERSRMLLGVTDGARQTTERPPIS